MFANSSSTLLEQGAILLALLFHGFYTEVQICERESKPTSVFEAPGEMEQGSIFSQRKGKWSKSTTTLNNFERNLQIRITFQVLEKQSFLFVITVKTSFLGHHF